MVSLGSPSSPPPSGGLLQEAFSSFIGVGELAFGKGDALRRYNLTPRGFWRAFAFSTVIAPIMMVLLGAGGGEAIDVLHTVGSTLTRIATTALTCIVIIRVRGMITAEGMGLGAPLDTLGPSTLPFLVPFLWASVVQAIILGLMLMGGSVTAQFLQIVVFVTTLLAQWRAARRGLGFSAATSVLMVLVFVISQTIITLLILSVLAILHGGSLHIEVQ